jgi:DNA-binding transcriptional LysR family regulator
VLNPTQVRTFGEVLATGSFAAAAHRLGYTASAVSQQISALERSTGLTLFERSARRIRPTRAAHVLGHHCSRVLDELTALEQQARALAAGQQGLVRVGSFATAAAALVPWALARFVRQQPDAEVSLEEGEPDELLPLLLDDVLDLALVYEYDLVPRRRQQQLTFSELVRERLLVLLPPAHPARGAAEIAPEDLAEETWITSRENTAGAVSLTRLCAAASFEPRVAYRTNDYDTVRELVQAGLGVALVPELAVTDDARPAAHPLRHPAPGRRVLAVRRTANPNPLLAPLEDALHRAAAAHRREQERPGG